LAKLIFLFLNAGIAQSSLISAVSNPDSLNQIMNTNFFGSIDTAYYALPYLKESKGHIAVTSSVVSKLSLRGASVYCASKAALNSFFDTLRKEERDIKITILCPGFVPTSVIKNAVNGEGKATNKQGGKLPFAMELKPAVRLMIDSVASNKMEVWYTFGATVLMTLRGAFPNAVDRLMGYFKLG